MKLNHIAISTPDIQRSLKFYSDLLGFSITYDSMFYPEKIDLITNLNNAKGRVVMVSKDDLAIELFEFASPKPHPMSPQRPVCDHGITHLCLEVDNIEEEYRRLSSQGVIFHCPPQTFGTAKATYGRDPDGNVIEFLQLSKTDN